MALCGRIVCQWLILCAGYYYLLVCIILLVNNVNQCIVNYSVFDMLAVMTYVTTMADDGIIIVT